MLASAWNLFGRDQSLDSSSASAPRRSDRFGIEMLEDRTTPASFTAGVDFTADAAGLIGVIVTANSNAEVDTIDLAGATITLTAINNTLLTGNNGLPSILPDSGNALTIQNGTIERDAMAADDFRLFRVADDAILTFSRVTLQGGLMTDEPSGSTSAAAILNLGELTISECLITGNDAFRGGGAIVNAVTGSITIENSTLSVAALSVLTVAPSSTRALFPFATPRSAATRV